MSVIVLRNLKRNFSKAKREPLNALRILYQRIRCGFAYKFFNGYAFPPETISLFLTYKCNLRCRMCGQWGENGAFRNYNNELLKKDLDFELIKKLILEIKKYKPVITLFGGEPALHPEFINILSFIKQNGLRCNMITNAALLSKYAEDIVRLKMDEIIVSLDGEEEIHDKIRGYEGIFKNVMLGLTAINDEKNIQHSKLPLININSTISPENYLHLKTLIPAAEKIKANTLTFHHLLFLMPDTISDFESYFNKIFHHIPVEWRGFSNNNLPNIDADKLIVSLKEALNTKTDVSCYIYPNFSSQEIHSYYNDIDFSSSTYKKRCLSPWMVAYIFPDGSVRPYHTMDYTIGNINETDFLSVWNNDKYKFYRNHIKSIGCFGVCKRGCTESYRY